MSAATAVPAARAGTVARVRTAPTSACRHPGRAPGRVSFRVFRCATAATWVMLASVLPRGAVLTRSNGPAGTKLLTARSPWDEGRGNVQAVVQLRDARPWDELEVLYVAPWHVRLEIVLGDEEPVGEGRAERRADHLDAVGVTHTVQFRLRRVPPDAKCRHVPVRAAQFVGDELIAALARGQQEPTPGAVVVDGESLDIRDEVAAGRNRCGRPIHPALERAARLRADHRDARVLLGDVKPH